MQTSQPDFKSEIAALPEVARNDNITKTVFQKLLDVSVEYPYHLHLETRGDTSCEATEERRMNSAS